MFSIEERGELDYLILDEPINKNSYTINEFCLNDINTFEQNLEGKLEFFLENNNENICHINIAYTNNTYLEVNTKLEYKDKKLFLNIDSKCNKSLENTDFLIKNICTEINLNEYFLELIDLMNNSYEIDIYNLKIVNNIIEKFKKDLFLEGINNQCFILIDCELETDIQVSSFDNSEKIVYQISDRAILNLTDNIIIVCEAIKNLKNKNNSISYLIEMKITDNITLSFTQTDFIAEEGELIYYTCFGIVADISIILIEKKESNLLTIKNKDLNVLITPSKKIKIYSIENLLKIYADFLIDNNEHNHLQSYYKNNKMRNIQNINTDKFLLFQGVI